MAEAPSHPLTRIRAHLREGGFRSAASRARLAAILGIGRTTIARLEQFGVPFNETQKEIVSNILDIHPAWLGSAYGPILSREGFPWNPSLVPALMQSRKLIGVVNLASSVGLEVLVRQLKLEQHAGRPGPATFGVLKLASELDGLAVAKAAANA